MIKSVDRVNNTATFAVAPYSTTPTTVIVTVTKAELEDALQRLNTPVFEPGDIVEDTHTYLGTGSDPLAHPRYFVLKNPFAGSKLSARRLQVWAMNGVERRWFDVVTEPDRLVKVDHL